MQTTTGVLRQLSLCSGFLTLFFICAGFVNDAKGSVPNSLDPLQTEFYSTASFDSLWSRLHKNSPLAMPVAASLTQDRSREVDLAADQRRNQIPRSFQDTANSISQPFTNGAAEWWNGNESSGICIQEKTSLIRNNASSLAPNANNAGQSSAPSEIVVCRIASASRICRTMQFLNSTTTNQIITTYKCCPGFSLTNNTCVLEKDKQFLNASVPAQNAEDAAAADISDDNRFPSILQQLLQQSLRSQSLFAQALDVGDAQEDPGDVEDTGGSNVPVKNLPVNKATLSVPVLPVAEANVTTPPDKTNRTKPESTVQTARSELHFSLSI